MPAVHGPPATGLSLRILGREVKRSEDLGRLDGKYVCWFHAADPTRFRDPSCRQQYDSGEALLKYCGNTLATSMFIEDGPRFDAESRALMGLAAPHVPGWLTASAWSSIATTLCLTECTDSMRTARRHAKGHEEPVDAPIYTHEVLLPYSAFANVKGFLSPLSPPLLLRRRLANANLDGGQGHVGGMRVPSWLVEPMNLPSIGGKGVPQGPTSIDLRPLGIATAEG
ncbi:hypothetical protein Purlil1_11429 [Purpureocillium lilacinum]|uniref:Uncharacterized protein n=1 Tax=Purpureocillium lilacinum TaxID=33203 RepID=A0ABR0BJM6_PURLI|nr:hypothetical protein Purlil1_11429 [Purpureocillium lilacinum]